MEGNKDMSEQYNKVTENQVFKSQLQEPASVESNKSTTGGFDIIYLLCDAILNCIDFLIDKWYVWIVLILVIAVIRYFLQ